MSHSFALSDEQRAHLSIAEADTARMIRLLRNQESGLTGYEWQLVAGLASSAAVQVQKVAQLAEPGASRTWATSARLLHEAAARFELWSCLADIEAEPAEVSADGAHEAA